MSMSFFHDFFTAPAIMEFVTGGAALLVQAVYLHVRKLRSRTVLMLTLLTLPAMYLSLESMNSFLTCDESYIVYEPVDLVNNSLLMWKMGAFRTTDLLVGIPLVVLKGLTGFSMDILAVFAKSLHWFLSFLLIIAIIELLIRHSGIRMKFPERYLITYYSISMLPVVLLAQKIINYDSFSMLFGVVALLLLALGWRKKRTSYLYSSMIVIMFAAQEKLIASPLAWLCLVIIPLRITFQQESASWSATFRSVWKETILTAAAAQSVLLVSLSLVSIVNTTGRPGLNACNVYHPLITGFWPLLQAAGITVDGFLADTRFDNWLYIPLFGTGIIAITTVATTMIAIAGKLVGTVRVWTFTGDWFSRNIQCVNYFLLFSLFMIGIAGTYLINAYLAPYHPVVPGTYEGHYMNKAFVYFGAKTLPVHIFLSICRAYATFANALPTPLLVVAMANCIWHVRKRSTPIPVMEFLFTGALMAPLLYGIFQIPYGNRYLNVFILLVTTRLLFDFIRMLPEYRHATILSLLLATLLVAEVVPFRPLYGSFRPIWSNYSSEYNTTPSRAVLNAWWMGWGEEVFLSGRRIRDHLKKSNPQLDGIIMYTNYLGDWLYKRNNARIVFLDTIDNIGYSENDYYILNRMGITQSALNFPERVVPFTVISFRGFVQAWVFRGSDLKAAGFSFRNVF